MSQSRNFLAGALGVCLLSGVTFAAADAEMLGANIPALPSAEPPVSLSPAVEAQPAQPSEVPPAARAISPVPVAAPAAPAAPVRRATPSTGGSDAELNCLARVILYEAGAESRAGQLAVAQVVINRTRSGRFPRTICGVINQRGQFSAIRSFRAPGGARWARALAVAREARSGGRVASVGNALFFHARHVRAFRGRTRVAQLGGHIFYR
ncbi:MAG TPA: cell wall hydrolase [Allosphingosinicella sp.]|nr:cell wall hydrolase [Allosphingosinicella sp.]